MWNAAQFQWRCHWQFGWEEEHFWYNFPEWWLTLKMLLILQPVRRCKTVRVCYFMGLFACGFETRATPSDSLATTANFASWNIANVRDVLLTPYRLQLFIMSLKHFITQLFFVFVKFFSASGKTQKLQNKKWKAKCTKQKGENKKAALRREQLIVSFLIMRG